MKDVKRTKNMKNMNSVKTMNGVIRMNDLRDMRKLIFVKNKLSNPGKSNDNIIIVIPNVKHRINMIKK